jgi:hypothetical protein
MKKRQTDFVDKLIRNSIANNYDSDEVGSMHAIAQSKSNYMQTLKVSD